MFIALHIEPPAPFGGAELGAEYCLNELSAPPNGDWERYR